MKILYFLICGLAGCTGFLMAGAESNNFIAQVYCNISGGLLFGTGMVGLAYLLIKEEEKR